MASPTFADEMIPFLDGAVAPLDQYRYRDEYERLRPHLGQVRCVLDIGCGLGVMDIYLARYQGTRHVHLADGTGKGIFHLAYSQDPPEPWNDVHAAHSFVKKLVPWATHLEAHDVANGIPAIKPPPDLIMSLLSCGFHYPVETYLDCFLRYPKARVLLDVRVRGPQHPIVNGVATMAAAGYVVEAVVERFDKGKRVLFTRDQSTLS